MTVLLCNLLLSIIFHNPSTVTRDFGYSNIWKLASLKRPNILQYKWINNLVLNDYPYGKFATIKETAFCEIKCSKTRNTSEFVCQLQIQYISEDQVEMFLPDRLIAETEPR